MSRANRPQVRNSLWKSKTGLHGKLSLSKNGMDRGAEENCVTKRESKTLNNGLRGAHGLLAI